MLLLAISLWLQKLNWSKRSKPWGATDSVGGGNQTDVIPQRDKSAALLASSRYHCLLQLSQLKPWNFKIKESLIDTKDWKTRAPHVKRNRAIEMIVM